MYTDTGVTPRKPDLKIKARKLKPKLSKIPVITHCEENRYHRFSPGRIVHKQKRTAGEGRRSQNL